MKFLPLEDGIQFNVGNLYPASVVVKTACLFLNKYYLFLKYDDQNQISVSVKPKVVTAESDWDKFVCEFNNELLFQYNHYIVQNESKDIRQLILGRALYEECVENEAAEIDAISNDGSVKNTENIAQEWNPDLRYTYGD